MKNGFVETRECANYNRFIVQLILWHYFQIILVIACTIAYVNSVPVGVTEPRPVAPMDQLAPLANVQADPRSVPESEKDLAAAPSYGYGYYYRPYHYGYYLNYYYGYPYRYGYYPTYRTYYGGWHYWELELNVMHPDNQTIPIMLFLFLTVNAFLYDLVENTTEPEQ